MTKQDASVAFGFAVPLLPGKEKLLHFSRVEKRARKNEFIESRTRAGITMERVWLQRNPDAWAPHVGDYFVNTYVELDDHGPLDPTGRFHAMLRAFKSGSAFDNRLLDIFSEMSGIDFISWHANFLPIRVASWSDSGAQKERKSALAFTVPILRGHGKAANAFGEQAYDKRREDVADSRKAIGLTREEVFIQHTPPWAGSDLMTVYVEGPQAVAKANTLRSSTSSFDQWFDSNLRQILPPFIGGEAARDGRAAVASQGLDIAMEQDWSRPAALAGVEAFGH